MKFETDSILPQEFYNRPTMDVARDLLGKTLILKSKNSICSGRIVETEAYLPENDPACHAFCGVTPRNIVMFGSAGMTYVYFCYGIHWMFNAVTEAEGKGAAVLIRAVKPIAGISTMQERRRKPNIKDLTNGPAKICQAFNISKTHNGNPLFSDNLNTPIIVESKFSPNKIIVTSRIGLSVGTNLKARFVSED